MKKLKIALLISGLLSGLAHAESLSEFVDQNVESLHEESRELASSVWEWAEVGYQEHKSTAAMQALLKSEGFDIQAGVAGMPTAFVATFGTKGPTIGVVAEMDALPGLSQQLSTHRESRSGHSAGHACGHNLLGTGSVTAAIVIKNWIKEHGMNGRVKLVSAPAEEGGAGKVYLVREGVFDDVDVAVTWHPSAVNRSSVDTTLANKSAKFRFRGIASHASASPENGRSALDAAEAMNYMVNMLREHVADDARIHYVITHGGTAPNIVPEFAEVWYYARSPRITDLQDMWARIEDAAKGAALGTSTSVDWEVIHGAYNVLPNKALAKLAFDNMTTFGGIEYSADEEAFAEALRQTLGDNAQKMRGVQSQIQPFNDNVSITMGSTDVGDVSWAVPTLNFVASTWVPGTTAHSWQAVVASGSEVGFKGMDLAAKVMAKTAIDLITTSEKLNEIKTEFRARRGDNFEYKPLVGDRQPPLDYRN